MPNSSREYLISTLLIVALVVIWYVNFSEIENLSASEEVAVSVNVSSINSDSIVVANFLKGYYYTPKFRGFKEPIAKSNIISQPSKPVVLPETIPNITIKGVIGHIVLAKIDNGAPQFWYLGDQLHSVTLESIRSDSIYFRFNNRIFSSPIP